jgi:hypothetical protein
VCFVTDLADKLPLPKQEEIAVEESGRRCHAIELMSGQTSTELSFKERILFPLHKLEYSNHI